MAKSEIIVINPEQIDYGLRLFEMRREELVKKIASISKTKKYKDHEKNYTAIFEDKQIPLTLLKEIDKIFTFGLSFYTSPYTAKESSRASVFFRKPTVNANLNLDDRRLVVKLERENSHLSTIGALADFPISNKRYFKKYSLKDSAKDVALSVRKHFIPEKPIKNDKEEGDKDFLAKMIELFADRNIWVREFVVHHSLKEKVQLEGIFTNPNFIHIKRIDGSSYKREIFTLAHELGHYMLDNEGLDESVVQGEKSKTGIEERWCNDFAHYLLVGNDDHFREIPFDQLTINDKVLNEVSREKHISRLALFCHMAYAGKISWPRYKKLKKDLDDDFEDKKKKEKAKNSGKSFFVSPKPIRTPLEERLYRNAFHAGTIDEYELAEHFKLKDLDKLEKFIYG